jgi:hypothetical protein
VRAAVVGAILATSVAGVALLQPSLAETLHDAKAREDVYLFPPPAELRAMTLGWTAAATDLIWARLHVEYGMHWSEKRDFPHLERYVDAILALEPDYRPLYMYVDVLMVYRPPKGVEIDARKARAYLERGTRERPDDYKVWQHYGEFLAFLAPAWLASDDERNEWRRDGAAALMRAVELGGDSSRSVPAATVLSKSRELRAQTIDHLRRAYVITDDPQERAEISAKLAQLEGDAGAAGGPSSREGVEKDMAFIDRRWVRDYPFLSRGTFLIIGPTTNPLLCAGRGRSEAPECAREWERALPSHREP